MAIELRSTTSLAGTTFGTTLGPPPSWQPDDVFILLIETAFESGFTLEGENLEDWELIASTGTGTPGTTGATFLAAYGRRATSVEGYVQISDPGDHIIATMLCFSGCITTGTPWEAQTTGVASSATTAVSIPGITTTVNNAFYVGAVANGTDTNTAQSSGQSNADLTGLAELFDANSAAGNGGGLTVIGGTKASAGSIGATSATLSTASVQARIAFALKPVPGAAEAAGSSAGVGSASAVGSVIRAGAGSSAGVGAASGVGNGGTLSAAVGSAAASGAASGVGRRTAAAQGVAAGVAAAAAISSVPAQGRTQILLVA